MQVRNNGNFPVVPLNGLKGETNVKSIKTIGVYAAFLTIFFAVLSSCGSIREDGFADGYKAGYADCEDDLQTRLEETWYEAGYSDGYSDAEYDFYDARFAEGYEAGYSDAASGLESIASPRGDDYVWFSLVGEAVVYHRYTLPLPSCATALSADGYYDPVEDIEEDYIPCPTCFP
jgi:hypothetical protein